jgi:hypothetical protein
MVFNITDQLLIRFSAFIRYCRKKLEYRELVHQLLADFKKAYGYNILTRFVVPMRLVRLIKMCLNKTYTKVCISKHLSDNFSVQNGVK